MKRVLALMALSTFGFAMAACTTDVGGGEGDDGMEPADLAPEGNKAILPVQGMAKTGGTAGAKTNGISYHKGPVMTNGITVYYIWYGNWAGNTATTILTDLAQNIGGSPYWNI